MTFRNSCNSNDLQKHTFRIDSDTTAPAETDSANDDVASDDVVLSVVAVTDWNPKESDESTEDDATEDAEPVVVNSQDLDELFTGLPSDELLVDVI